MAEPLPDVAVDAARVAELALAEDGERDVSTEVAGVGALRGVGRIESRGTYVAANLAYASAVADRAGSSIEWCIAEGEVLAPGAVLGRIQGPLGAVLRAERPLLNLLQRAAGIATQTRAFVDALAGSGCQVLHTRKTVPGLRAFDIRAVLAGGGAAHRVSLAQTVLLKDNHWRGLEAADSTLEAAVRRARSRGLYCIVEVESAQQVEQACAAGVDRLLIDNQAPATVAQWVAVARRVAPAVEIEASGGITPEHARSYAEAGAGFVSVGALTHSVAAADLAVAVVAGESR